MSYPTCNSMVSAQFLNISRKALCAFCVMCSGFRALRAKDIHTGACHGILPVGEDVPLLDAGSVDPESANPEPQLGGRHRPGSCNLSSKHVHQPFDTEPFLKSVSVLRHLFFFIFKITFLFWSYFRKVARKYREFIPVTKIPLLLASSITVVPLLKLRNQHWYFY